MAAGKKRAAPREPLAGEPSTKRLLRSAVRAGASGPGPGLPSRKKRSASADPVPDEPQLKKPKVTPSPEPLIALRNTKYILNSLSDVPESLLHRKATECSLEFLTVPDGEASQDSQSGATVTSRSRRGSEHMHSEPINHCIIRLTFDSVQDEGSEWAPTGTRGVLIDCHYSRYLQDASKNIVSPAEIHIQTFGYTGPRRFAQEVKDVPVRIGKGGKGRNLADFLRMISKKDMLPVAFTSPRKRNTITTNGCRDWTSQLIQHWNSGGIVKLPKARKGSSFMECYNYAYGPGGQKVNSQVRHAAFAAGYVRVDIPGVNYLNDGDPRYDPNGRYTVLTTD